MCSFQSDLGVVELRNLMRFELLYPEWSAPLPKPTRDEALANGSVKPEQTWGECGQALSPDTRD